MRISKKNIVLIFVGILALCSTLGYLISKRNQDLKIATNTAQLIRSEGQASSVKIEQDADIVIRGIKLQEMRHEKNKDYTLFMKAKQSSFSHVSNEMDCRDAVCTVVDKTGTIAQFKADISLVDREKQGVTFPGQVVGRFGDYRILGRNAYYDPTKNNIEFKDLFYGTYKNVKFFAHQGSFDLKTKSISLGNGVRTEIEIPEKDNKDWNIGF
ncbi:MAG: hypothetical protein ABH827_00300 [bacterium]